MFAVALLLLVVRVFFGGGARLERSDDGSAIPASAVEQVAALDYPPGNIAVSARGRVFLTLHPDGKPPTKVAELVDGKPVPFPDAAFAASRPRSRCASTVRIGSGCSTHADYAQGSRASSRSTSRSRQLVHQYDFPSEVAGFLSMLNDFAVSPDGRASTSPSRARSGRRRPLVVYDVEHQTSRRLLDRHPSVLPRNYVMNVDGRDMVVLGVYTLRIGVDSITLDRRGE